MEMEFREHIERENIEKESFPTHTATGRWGRKHPSAHTLGEALLDENIRTAERGDVFPIRSCARVHIFS